MATPRLVLKAGQILTADSTQGSLTFLLPEELVLFFVSLKSGSGTVWVSQNNPESVEATIKKVAEAMKSAGEQFGFFKFLVATDHQSAKENVVLAVFQKHQLRADGNLVRKGPLSGQIDFKAARMLVEKKTRVMIVDDSKTIRDLLSRIFSADPELEIIAAVEHPHLALKLIPELKPDVITLDIHMPDMDGVTLLKSYLPKNPIPTIMISSITMEEGPMVLNALEAGAVDYIQKPSFQELAQTAPLLVEKVKMASRSKVTVFRPAETKKSTPRLSGKISENALIVIGSSTGGTEALRKVFLDMPESIPPILVVQHIPPVFSKAFADRLNTLCPFEVREAADGDLVKPNLVLIAPGGKQMEVVNRGKELRIKITDEAPMNRHKPSVDYLFYSIVKVAPQFNVMGAILTGMGADGAKGLKALREVGVRTIAQDEASCVVFGMPREAIKIGAAQEVLTLSDIAQKLMEWSIKEDKSSFKKAN